jgi:hypothetical protein
VHSRNAIRVAERCFDSSTNDAERLKAAEAAETEYLHFATQRARRMLDGQRSCEEIAAQAAFAACAWECRSVHFALCSALTLARSFRSTRQCIALLREVLGNPFRPVALSPACHTDTAVSLARTMYESRDFSAMPILADALQDAGCDNDDILSHCRDPKQVHVCGCWVVDLVLGRA